MVEASVEHDCECKCDGEETYELFVGDKSLCTKEQCEQKVSECTTANSANFVSCMCWCGGDDGGLHRNLFAAERESDGVLGFPEQAVLHDFFPVGVFPAVLLFALTLFWEVLLLFVFPGVAMAISRTLFSLFCKRFLHSK